MGADSHPTAERYGEGKEQWSRDKETPLLLKGRLPHAYPALLGIVPRPRPARAAVRSLRMDEMSHL